MTATLLAVDDSKTMRKVLEITFAGEDYKMVLANSPADALAKLKAERPVIALVDALLGASNGYDLCQQIKTEAPQVGVIVLASKQHPYDRVRGSSVGADDFIDKPYDSQALIDKVATLSTKLATSPAARPTAAVADRPQEYAAPRPAASTATAPGPAAIAAKPVASPVAAPAATAAGTTRNTMSFGAAAPTPSATAVKPAPIAVPSAQQPAIAVRPAPAPVAAQPSSTAVAPRPIAPVAAPVAAPPAVLAATAAAAPVALIDASMESKLGALGLTKDQIAGVLALSREVIEQVVWEVVPVLAETMIREEIQRVTAE